MKSHSVRSGRLTEKLPAPNNYGICVFVSCSVGADLTCRMTTGSVRLYRATNLEGHVWTFSQLVRRVGRAVAERLGGVRTTGWHRE